MTATFRGTVREARAEALHRLLRCFVGQRVALDVWLYWQLENDGWSRKDLELAIDDLIRSRRAYLEINPGLLILVASPERRS